MSSKLTQLGYVSAEVLGAGIRGSSKKKKSLPEKISERRQAEIDVCLNCAEKECKDKCRFGSKVKAALNERRENNESENRKLQDQQQ